MTPANPTILFGSNAPFVEALYEDFLHDPNSVDAEWRAYFESLKGGNGQKEVAHSSVQRAFAELVQHGVRHVAAAPAAQVVPNGVTALVNAFRAMGHLEARSNPLHLRPIEHVVELEPSYYGLSESDLNIQVHEGDFKGTLREVIAELRQTYCGSIGFEYSYLPRIEREWLQGRIESSRGRGSFDAATQKRILEKLNAGEGLERYLHKRYVGQKRFSLEGSEAMIPSLDQLILMAGAKGVKEVAIGMAHRGRLNVLINIMGKQSKKLFDEFEGKKQLPADVAGDVKYHMGFSSDMPTPGGDVHLMLAFNPSHLEVVDPVIEGSVRARQDRRGDENRDQVLPVLIHGDAAVAGQGVVAETLNLSRLRGFGTGGSFHLVINNQVGFSVSDLRDARTSRYSTDIAKFVDAPVFHVNGDDAEAVVYATQLALEYRMAFHKDVFLDLISYRRHGHNESDEPRATQPIMYKEIDTHPTTRALYAEQLEKAGVVTAAEVNQLIASYRDKLDAGEKVTEATETDVHHIRGKASWAPIAGKRNRFEGDYTTAMPLDEIKRLGAKLTTLPEGFKLHRRVEAIINARREMYEGKNPLDWGAAENLAYAGLVVHGFPVRITGQDVGRGTFFHRHAILHNQEQVQSYAPIQHLSPDQARFDIYDSTLSEEAVLAFEYGYSCTSPDALVIWEAQYGDFANMAQAIIDQFIASGETKWERYCGLVMLLPHGFEGQGPEHSSARLERYLQLCADDNMQVCVPSTPAQMFHMLRRQVLRPLRKPLVVMSPKSLLRHKLSVSTLDELAGGCFREVIDDAAVSKGAKRVVLSSGKHYFDLFEAREAQGKQSEIALVRVEQLYPFPAAAVSEVLAKHPGAQVVWSQEEPANNGAWFAIRDELTACLASGQTLSLASRPASASPAVGYPAKHNEQQAALIASALG